MAETRTYVVTGAASGIGAATTRWLRERGGRVVTSDLHDADIIADLATPEGREALAEGVARLGDGRIDAIVANAGGGPAQTSLQLNFFGAVATLERLRPLLTRSPAPRAVAVSSVASLSPARPEIVEACLVLDESRAKAAARAAYDPEHLAKAGLPSPDFAAAGLQLYGAAKLALQLWIRRVASTPEWAGAGIVLNAVAMGFYDTPAAAYVLADPEARARAGRLEPLRGAFPGRPEEAAALLAWCVSPENSQMTGQVLYADGGMECQLRGAQRP